MNSDTPSFDPTDYLLRAGSVEPFRGRYWITTMTIGPYEALVLIKVRAALVSPLVTFGPAMPVDLFMLATGDAPQRCWTKIGGLPYRGTDRPWPTGADGQRLPFLAQFDFRCSHDIIADVPGDVLLIFAHPNFHNGLALEWERIEDSKALVKADDAMMAAIPVFHCYRWRTSCYPKAQLQDDDSWDSLMLPNDVEVLQPQNIFTPYGIQIGSFPALPPDGIGLHENDQIICSLSMIRPWADNPLPFINRDEPLTDAEVKNYTIELSTYPPGSDVFGAFYVIRSGDGSFRGKLAYL